VLRAAAFDSASTPTSPSVLKLHATDALLDLNDAHTDADDNNEHTQRISRYADQPASLSQGVEQVNM
jgi:hypothetical protein